MLQRTSSDEAPLERSTVLRARELAPATRAWIGSILHIDLTDEDECTLTLRRSMETQTPEQRAIARKRLFELFRQIDAQVKEVPDEEIEAAIDEAIRSVRLQPH